MSYPNEFPQASSSGRPHRPPLLRVRQRHSGIRGAVAGATTPPPNTGNGSNSTPGTSDGHPWDDDPILQQIRANEANVVSQAQAAALASRHRDLIGFGYVPGLDYGDTATRLAAMQNPFSVIGQLSHTHDLARKNIDESNSVNNTFYGSYRGQQLGEEGRNYLSANATAQGRLNDELNAIANNLLNIQQASQGRITQAEQDAYNRYLDYANQYGYSGTDSADASGGASSTGGSATADAVASALAGPGKSHHPGATSWIRSHRLGRLTVTHKPPRH